MDAGVDREAEKRRRTLDAARFLILRDGLRGTTMEAIAREAGIAKPTLYAQFADKDAIFAAIVDALLDEITAASDRGLDGPGDVAERIGAALAGQYAALARSLDGSPHAAELMSEHKRAGMQLRQKDLQAQGRIAGELRAAGVPDPERLTRVIVAAAYGIAFKTTDQEQMVAGIKLMCRRMIGPELA